MLLRAAYLSFHRYAQTLLADRGLTADQYVLLSLLAEQDGITQKDLGRRAATDPNTTTSMLKLLEARSLVRRRKDRRDGRALLVFLTAKGRRLVKASYPGPLDYRLRKLMGDAAARKAITLWLRRTAETFAEDHRELKRGRSKPPGVF